MVKILLQIPGIRTVAEAKKWAELIGDAMKRDVFVLGDTIDVKLLDVSDDAKLTIYLKSKAGDIGLYTTEEDDVIEDKEKDEK